MQELDDPASIQRSIVEEEIIEPPDAPHLPATDVASPLPKKAVARSRSVQPVVVLLNWINALGLAQDIGSRYEWRF